MSRFSRDTTELAVVLGALWVPSLVDAGVSLAIIGPVTWDGAVKFDAMDSLNRARLLLPITVLFLYMVGWAKISDAPPVRWMNRVPFMVEWVAIAFGLVAVDLGLGYLIFYDHFSVSNLKTESYHTYSMFDVVALLSECAAVALFEEPLRLYVVRAGERLTRSRLAGFLLGVVVFTSLHLYLDVSVLAYQFLVSGLLYCGAASILRNHRPLMLAHVTTNFMSIYLNTAV